MDRERALKSVDKEIKRVLYKKNPLLNELFKDSALEEGKRLRAKLFFAFSGSYDKNSIKAAAALELLHMATLIHDDILDKSPLRRGKPPLYLKWDIPMSVLYGDYLFSCSFALITEVKNPRIWEEIVTTSSETLKGEMHQHYRKMYALLTKREYLSIIEKKSGVLFGAACKLGAIIRGNDGVFVNKAYKFGINVGIAYQIFDDCSDYLGLDKNKQKFNDIREGIITLPMIYLLKKCSEKEKKDIKKLLKKSKLNFKDIEKIVLLMKNYDVITDSFEESKRFLGRARRTLAQDLNFEFLGICDILSWMEREMNNA